MLDHSDGAVKDIDIPGYCLRVFCHGLKRYPLYVGGKGPAVLLVHELPGITPQVISLAHRIKENGFTVYMPSLFGTPVKKSSPVYLMQSCAKVCVSREFRLLAARQASPITHMLRAICRLAHSESGGAGVGAIGMCVSGNFALSLMLDKTVIAPVLLQPSLPILQREGLHISEPDLVQVCRRMERDDLSCLAVRFSHDPLCPRARFERLRKVFAERFQAIEIDSSLGNAEGISRFAHAALTLDFVDTEGHPTRFALDRVLEFLNQRLQVNLADSGACI